jgi:glycosyltransferase involved in cell wall biosynthesis
MDSNILISVIIPVYNKEERIKNAIDSVLNTNKNINYEIVLVDDGSTDSSGEIIDVYAHKYKNIRAIHQTNQWVYAAFNRGIKEAKGEYIYILNADDALFDGAIDYLIKNIEAYNYPDVIWTRCIMYSERAKNTWIEESMGGAQTDDFYCFNQEMVHDNWSLLYKDRYIENQANLYKRELAVNHPFRNDVYAADGLFNISIAEDISTCLTLKKPIYKYFRYNDVEKNISKGKFYDYQHSMNNELYVGQEKLLLKWNHKDVIEKNLSRWRINAFMDELYSLCKENCPYSVEEKLERIFDVYIDEIVLKCVENLSADEEFDARVIFGMRRIFCENKISEESKYYFYFELVQGLHRFEKDEADRKKIEAAIINKNNKYGIGKHFAKNI